MSEKVKELKTAPVSGKVYTKTQFQIIGFVNQRKNQKCYLHLRECVKTATDEGFKYECHKDCKYGNDYYLLDVECEIHPDKLKNEQIVCYKDKIIKFGNEKTWKAIDLMWYIGKKLLFICHRYKKEYKLIELRDLTKPQGG